MINEEELDLFLDQLLEDAVRSFHTTEHYALIQEKRKTMDVECRAMFTPDEQEFAEECFSLLLETEGQMQRYVYRRGMLDGISLLKRLGVLA